MLIIEANELEEVPEMISTQQMIASGDKVQDQTQESVNRMKALVRIISRKEKLFSQL